LLGEVLQVIGERFLERWPTLTAALIALIGFERGTFFDQIRVAQNSQHGREQHVRGREATEHVLFVRERAPPRPAAFSAQPTMNAP
jgi:hypothetical protein